AVRLFLLPLGLPPPFWPRPPRAISYIALASGAYGVIGWRKPPPRAGSSFTFLLASATSPAASVVLAVVYMLVEMTLAIVVIAALGVETFLYRPYTIPSGAM